MQEDKLETMLSVQECMTLAANLKLGYQISDEEKQLAVSGVQKLTGPNFSASLYREEKLEFRHTRFISENEAAKATFGTTVK